MTPDETTREFAERLRANCPCNGVGNDKACNWNCPCGNSIMSGVCKKCNLNPTDRDEVHTALMGMSEDEWVKFSLLVLKHNGWLLNTQDDWNSELEYMITRAFRTPLPALVSCYLEATKGRVKSATASAALSG